MDYIPPHAFMAMAIICRMPAGKTAMITTGDEARAAVSSINYPHEALLAREIVNRAYSPASRIATIALTSICISVGLPVQTVERVTGGVLSSNLVSPTAILSLLLKLRDSILYFD